MKQLVILLVLVLCLVTVNAQKVKVVADKAVDLTKYKTYSWSQGMASPNPITNQTIIDTVDSALQSKGMTKVEKDADVVLVVFATSDSALHTSNTSTGSAAKSGIAARSQTWAVTEGTLVVDIADARTKERLWRGTATDMLDQGPTGDVAKDAKSVSKKIKKAVEKMFKRFPQP
ncbi:MAG TPA: DUF4136 domain-containing protein [Pyrinomonadaceae bacterium]|nr:DUF4136 domain-containing protein [Pyrinomonadaceae bacterium]